MDFQKKKVFHGGFGVLSEEGNSFECYIVLRVDIKGFVFEIARWKRLQNKYGSYISCILIYF